MATSRRLVRLEVEVEVDGRAHQTTTVNLSTSGMLVRLAVPARVGGRVRFVLRLTGVRVVGWAKVMRLTRPDEAVGGVGVRFTSFEGDALQRLSAYLENVRRSR